MKVSDKKKRENTDILFDQLGDKYVQAKSKPEGVLREVALKTAENSEWYVLNACLTIEPMRQLYDGMRIARRLDEMMAEMRKSYEASKEQN